MNAQIRTGRFKLAWFIAGIAVLPLSAVGLGLDFLNCCTPLGMLNWGFASPLASKYLVAMQWRSAWLVNGLCIGFLAESDCESLLACRSRPLDGVFIAGRSC